VVNKSNLAGHPVIKEVASRMGATTAQVLIAWGVYRGYSVIPKSVNKERIVTNFKQVELFKENYEKISTIGRK
jgi:L-glyceraldehyde reductase